MCKPVPYKLSDHAIARFRERIAPDLGLAQVGQSRIRRDMYRALGRSVSYRDPTGRVLLVDPVTMTAYVMRENTIVTTLAPKHDLFTESLEAFESTSCWEFKHNGRLVGSTTDFARLRRAIKSYTRQKLAHYLCDQKCAIVRVLVHAQNECSFEHVMNFCDIAKWTSDSVEHQLVHHERWWTKLDETKELPW